MKRILAACVCVLVATMVAKAEFKMPKSVYRIDQLEKAKAEAEAKGEEHNRLLKDAIKKLSAAPAKPGLSAKPAAIAPVFSIPPGVDREQRTWRPATGAPIEAALLQERAGMITLKNKDGSKLELLSTSLSAED